MDVEHEIKELQAVQERLEESIKALRKDLESQIQRVRGECISAARIAASHGRGGTGGPPQ